MMSKRPTAIKDKFQEEFAKCMCPVTKAGKCQTCKTENSDKSDLNSPVVFCVEKILSRHKGDKPKHCDEIILCDVAHQKTGEQRTGVYCIEHKGGNPNNFEMDRIRDQLQGGADIVCNDLHPNERINFRPVLVAKKNEQLRQRTILYRSPVMVNDKKYLMKYVEIGEKLPAFGKSWK